MHVERQIADFVEEQRAPVRELEASLAQADGTGEGALFMPEELTLDQAGRQRGAVHPYQRTRPATAALVDGAAKQFLASAGFAQQQDRAIERRDLCEPLQGFTHHRALADDLVEIVDRLDLLFEADVVSGQSMVELLDLGHARTKRRVLPAPLQRAADDAGQEPHSILCRRRPLAHPLAAADHQRPDVSLADGDRHGEHR